MIRHHLTDSMMIAYAAGTLPEAFALVAATHVSLCDDCRVRLGAFEVVGGAVLDSDDDFAPMDSGVEACFARQVVPTVVAPTVQARRSGILPAPLAAYVAGGLDAVKWRPLGMGVRQAILPTSKYASARLLYIPAGAAVPDHGHRGTELTLVLQGAFRDDSDRFGPGDVEVADEQVQHIPVAEAGVDCICLAASDAPLRFKDWLPRLLQPIFRI